MKKALSYLSFIFLSIITYVVQKNTYNLQSPADIYHKIPTFFSGYSGLYDFAPVMLLTLVVVSVTLLAWSFFNKAFKSHWGQAFYSSMWLILISWMLGNIWINLHRSISQPAAGAEVAGFINTLSIVHLCINLIFLLLYFQLIRQLTHAVKAEDKSLLDEKELVWRSIKNYSIYIVGFPIVVGLSLISFDLITVFSGNIAMDDFYGNDSSFFFRFYSGTLALIAFSVTLFVAYVRNQSLEQSRKQYAFSQEQFNFTQTQRSEEEIEKRFQEGVKLLGNENESVRLGGIFILWEIVKDAVKALPFLEQGSNKVLYVEEDEQIHIQLVSSLSQLSEEKRKEQETLKAQYAETNQINKVSEAEIKRYSKAFSLYQLIFNILCAHVRTLTNDEEYLKKYYPSIYQERYPKKFIDAFGKKGEFTLLDEKDEVPSNEIQSLLKLFTYSSSNNQYEIQSYALNMHLDLSFAILKGINLYGALLERANLAHVNLNHAYLFSAEFNEVECYKTQLQYANCKAMRLNITGELTNFSYAKCSTSRFTGSRLVTPSFVKTKCKEAIFKGSSLTAPDFSGANLHGAQLDGSELIDMMLDEQTLLQNSSFDGINALLGKKGEIKNNGLTITNDVESDKLFITRDNYQELAARFNTNSLNLETPWRISVHELEPYFKVLAGQNYSFSLEQFQINEKLLLLKDKIELARKQIQTPQQSDIDLKEFYLSLDADEQEIALTYFNDFDNFNSSTQAEEISNQYTVNQCP